MNFHLENAGNHQPPPTLNRNWVLRGLMVVGVLVVGSWLTSLCVSSAPESWYASLEKVPWTPPPWVFSPVWITLYSLIGISFTLQWRQGFGTVLQRRARTAFFIQIVLNFSYTPVQFGLQWLGMQAVIIVGVWIAALAWVLLLAKFHRTAALLQIPYLLWVSYAVSLSVGLWWLNS